MLLALVFVFIPACIPERTLEAKAASYAYGTKYQIMGHGNTVTAYPLSTEKLTIYKNSDCKTEIGTVKGKALTVKLKKYRDQAFYGTCKTSRGNTSGWFREKDFVRQPAYEHEMAAAKSRSTIYGRKSGSPFGTISFLSAMEIIGKSGSWYQVICKCQSDYRIGWIKESVLNYTRWDYDSREKKLLAEGTYYLTPKSAPYQHIEGSAKGLSLKEANSSSRQKFKLQFVGNNCYQIIHAATGLCLAATPESEEKIHLAAASENAGHANQVVLERVNDEINPGQIWQLTRSGSYFFLKNAGTDGYLTASRTFTLGAQNQSGKKQFRFTMATNKNRTNYQVFSQYDPDWGSKGYGKTNSMAASACGVLSLTNAVYALNGQYIDPMVLADFSVRAGYRIPGQGTAAAFFNGAARKFGKTYGFTYAGSTSSLTTLKNHLKNGGTAVGRIPGHYMAIGDYKNGRYLVLDCYASNKRKTTPYGDWKTGGDLRSGHMRFTAFYLIKAIR